MDTLALIRDTVLPDLDLDPSKPDEAGTLQVLRLALNAGIMAINILQVSNAAIKIAPETAIAVVREPVEPTTTGNEA